MKMRWVGEVEEDEKDFIRWIVEKEIRRNIDERWNEEEGRSRKRGRSEKAMIEFWRKLRTEVNSQDGWRRAQAEAEATSAGPSLVSPPSRQRSDWLGRPDWLLIYIETSG
jgi:hypothetical protein